MKKMVSFLSLISSLTKSKVLVFSDLGRSKNKHRNALTRHAKGKVTRATELDTIIQYFYFLYSAFRKDFPYDLS